MLSELIDHSVLKPDFSREEIINNIKIGIAYKCKSVCVNPSSIDLAYDLCHNTQTKVCTVCDFPFGCSSLESRINQVQECCSTGKIFELDIVAKYGWIRSNMWDEFVLDSKNICDLCHRFGVGLKVILETDALSIDQIVRSTIILADIGVDFVKTSTGFYLGDNVKGASVDIVDVLLKAANGKIKVKAAGGIRTKDHFLNLVKMGVHRFGIGFKSTPVVLSVD